MIRRQDWSARCSIRIIISLCRQISEARHFFWRRLDAGKRERFTGANSIIRIRSCRSGYYASGNLEVPELPVEKFEAPTVKLVNDDILYAEIEGSE